MACVRRLLATILLGLVLLGPGMASRAESASEAPEHDVRAEEKAPSQQAVAEFQRGLELERTNRCGEAIQSYRIARDLGFDSGEAMARIGFCYRIVADRKEVSADERNMYLQRAAMALSRALQQDPANRSALGNLADLAYNAGDHSSALKLYQQMDRLDPSLFRLCRGQAKCGNGGGRNGGNVGEHQGNRGKFHRGGQGDRERR